MGDRRGGAKKAKDAPPKGAAKPIGPRKPIRSPQFIKDFHATGANPKCDRDALRVVMGKLIHREPLNAVYRNHRLTDDGTYTDCWECHTSNDWVLVYRLAKDNGEDVIVFVRTGTHAVIFE